MSYNVKASDLQFVSLCEDDTVASVLQNVALIIGTRQGTIPLHRSFGLPMNFLDKPMEVAKTLMVSEIETYVPELEPRAKIVGISFEYDDNTYGQLIPVVEVEIVDE